MSESRIIQCYLAARKGDATLFVQRPDGGVDVNLVGYAIVPLEDFDLHIKNAAEAATRLRKESP